MALNLLDEFKCLIAAIREPGIDYALVGALALAVHGIPRATTDIDILVEPQDVDPALDAARRCGFRIQATPMQFRDGMELRRTSKIEGKDHLTLDIILVNDNLRSIWESRTNVETEFGPVRVVSRDALIRMKAASGRPRDLGDIESLEELDR